MSSFSKIRDYRFTLSNILANHFNLLVLLIFEVQSNIIKHFCSYRVIFCFLHYKIKHLGGNFLLGYPVDLKCIMSSDVSTLPEKK